MQLLPASLWERPRRQAGERRRQEGEVYMPGSQGAGLVPMALQGVSKQQDAAATCWDQLPLDDAVGLAGLVQVYSSTFGGSMRVTAPETS